MDPQADFAEIEKEVAGLIADSVDQAPSPQQAALLKTRLEGLSELKDRLGKPPPPRKPAFLPVPCLGNNMHTPLLVVDEMLELAAPAKDDVLFDLGCGDGRIAIAAARKFQVETVGVDLNPIFIKVGTLKAKLKKVKVRFEQTNALTVDLTHATVILLHFNAEGNLKLRPRLQQLSGVRIVSYDADMGDWKPQKEVEVVDERKAVHTIYLWEVPRKAKEGKRTTDQTGRPAKPQDMDREIWEDLE